MIVEICYRFVGPVIRSTFIQIDGFSSIALTRAVSTGDTSLARLTALGCKASALLRLRLLILFVFGGHGRVTIATVGLLLEVLRTHLLLHMLMLLLVIGEVAIVLISSISYATRVADYGVVSGTARIICVEITDGANGFLVIVAVTRVMLVHLAAASGTASRVLFQMCHCRLLSVVNA